MGNSSINPIVLTNGMNRRRFLQASMATLGGGLAAAAIGSPKPSSRAELDALRRNKPGEDLNAKETRQAEVYWPKVRPRAIKMYKAEEKDNEKISAGGMRPEKRNVKVSIVDFSPPGTYLDIEKIDGQYNDRRTIKSMDLHDDELKLLYPADGGSQATLFVSKYFDDVQKDGTVLRTYANEQWPLIFTKKNGKLELGVLPTELFRFNVQLFPGDIHKPGAEDLMVRDMVQAIWAPDNGGVATPLKKGFQPTYATFFRQHLWGEHNPKKHAPFSNKYQQLHTPVSTTSCVQCHNPKSSARIADRLFLHGKERTNFAATVPDEEFSDVKPLSQQKGYKMLMSFMARRLKAGKVTQAHFDQLKKELADTRSFENPYIVPSFKNASHVPFVGEDKPPVRNGGPYDEGFEYFATDEKGRYDLTKPLYRNQAVFFQGDLGLGDGWWGRNEPIIPHGRF